MTPNDLVLGETPYVNQSAILYISIRSLHS
jgi:hypothetical protein